jgi:hypothetical protein
MFRAIFISLGMALVTCYAHAQSTSSSKDIQLHLQMRPIMGFTLTAPNTGENGIHQVRYVQGSPLALLPFINTFGNYAVDVDLRRKKNGRQELVIFIVTEK